MGFSDTQTGDPFFVSSSHQSSPYIGRFAPSPTGPLHIGSLIAAVASYLCAKQSPQGKWLLRIEDIDTQRTQKGATQSIIHTLEAYGFHWDGEITYQSQRTALYQQALDALSAHTYPCSCTRKSLTSCMTNYSYIYPGYCRDGLLDPNSTHLSIRLKTDNHPVGFVDRCQPKPLQQKIRQDIGDFILKRRDGLWAYQLAVVVDDALQNVTDVVRGADLFDNTPRQLYLQRLLGYPTPQYLHFPVITDAKGKKLSKQNLSPALSHDQKHVTIIKALKFLGQHPPPASSFQSIDDIWQWAIQHWNIDNIPKVMTIHE